MPGKKGDIEKMVSATMPVFRGLCKDTLFYRQLGMHSAATGTGRQRPLVTAYKGLKQRIGGSIPGPLNGQGG